MVLERDDKVVSTNYTRSAIKTINSINSKCEVKVDRMTVICVLDLGLEDGEEGGVECDEDCAPHTLQRPPDVTNPRLFYNIARNPTQ